MNVNVKDDFKKTEDYIHLITVWLVFAACAFYCALVYQYWRSSPTAGAV